MFHTMVISFFTIIYYDVKVIFVLGTHALLIFEFFGHIFKIRHNENLQQLRCVHALRVLFVSFIL